VSYVLVHEEWYEELPAEVTAELEAQMEWFLEAARSRRCVPVAVIAAEVGYVESSIYRLAREGLVYAEERPAVGGHGSDYQWYVDPVEVRAWVGLSLKVRRAIGDLKEKARTLNYVRTGQLSVRLQDSFPRRISIYF